MEILSLAFETKIFLFTQFNNLISLPDFQRMKNDQHVKDIFDYNDSHFKKHKCFHILGSISVGLLKSETNHYMLLDGQHRICAYNLLYEKYKKDFSLSVEIYQKNTIEEIHDIYDRINKNLPLPICFPEYSDTILVNQYINKLQKEYSNFIKTSLKPRVPNININSLSKAIYNSEILQILKTNKKELFEETICLNNYFINLPFHILIENQTNWGIKLKQDKIQNSFFLGYFQEFEWLGFIIEHVKNNKCYKQINFKTQKKYNSVAVPKQRRIKLWETHFKDKTKGNCFICDEFINVYSFEAGHIIAKALGGTNELTNLKPICKTCNRDMGTQNLLKYKEQFEK